MSKYIPFRAYILFSPILCLFACGKNQTESPTKLGLTYYPLQIGKYKIYQQDSVTFKPLANNQVKRDSFRLQLKETVADTFRDNTGALNYRIERYKRTSDTLPWQITNVVSTTLTTDLALRTDDNLTFIKMPLAYIQKTAWSGDAYIDSLVVIQVNGENLEFISKKRWNWVYDIESLDKPEQVGAVNFPNVTTSLAQIDPKILTEKRYWLEKYASEIGLVYKEQQILDSQNLNSALTWIQRAQKGYILKQTLLSYN